MNNLNSTHKLLDMYPDYSAYFTLSGRQKVFLICLIAGSLFFIYFDWIAYFLAVNILCTIFYVAFSLYKMHLVTLGIFRGKELCFTREELCSLEDAGLPVYTILVPLYREPETLLRLKEALDALQYCNQ